MKSILSAFRQFPYRGIGRLFFFDYLVLKLFPRLSFPSISIIPLVMKHYALDSQEEFRFRYYASRIGYQTTWESKDRSSEEATRAFYNEQDGDLWRQAYLSKNQYMYKKQILLAYHIALKIRAKKVLDYGCGAGVLAHYLKKHGVIVDAADIPSPTLNFVQKRLGLHMAMVINDDLTLPVNEYDMVTCLGALEHTFTPLSITKNLMQSLKSGGIFNVNFPIETDSTHDDRAQHTREAQAERPATFEYLRQVCIELVPESIYRKK